MTVAKGGADLRKGPPLAHARTSAEREAVRLDANVEELNLEPAVGDQSGLADELVRARFAYDPAAAEFDITARSAVRDLRIEVDAEWDRGALRDRPDDEVDVARVELECETSTGLVRETRSASAPIS